MQNWLVLQIIQSVVYNMFMLTLLYSAHTLVNNYTLPSIDSCFVSEYQKLDPHKLLALTKIHTNINLFLTTALCLRRVAAAID